MFIALWIHLWPNDWITTNWICTAMTITKVRLCYFNPEHIKCKEWSSSPSPHPTMLLVVQIKWENWVYSMNGWKKQKDCIGVTNDKKKRSYWSIWGPRYHDPCQSGEVSYQHQNRMKYQQKYITIINWLKDCIPLKMVNRTMAMYQLLTT